MILRAVGLCFLVASSALGSPVSQFLELQTAGPKDAGLQNNEQTVERNSSEVNSSDLSLELHSPSPAELINSTQRLAVDQIESLLQSGQYSDSVSQLQSLKDLSPLLIERTAMQRASTQGIQPYQTLESWYQVKLQSALAAEPSLLAEFHQQWDAMASASIKQIQRSKSIQDAQANVGRYRSTSDGDLMALMLVDLQLEKGQAVAAVQSLCTHFSGLLRSNLRELNPQAASTSIMQHQLWKWAQSNPSLLKQCQDQWKIQAGKNEKLTVDVLSRLLTATAIQPQTLDFDSTLTWIESATKFLQNAEQRNRLEIAIREVQAWPSTQSTGTQSSSSQRVRVDFDQRSAWQLQLERWVNSSDLTPATKPPVGQLQAALPYHPVVYDGKVFVHELTRIRSYQLDNGSAWPKGSPNTSVFDSQISATALVPLGYPLVGLPRGDLAIEAGCIYARMGSPVTAWVNRSKSNDGSSISFITGLDIDRQGALLAGFPLRLTPPNFKDAEFEGTPVIDGRQLIVAISERDNVGVRRSLAAFDRFSGALRWRTQALGSGVVVGSERANLISASQPMVIGGSVFYNTDLGSIACVDAASGKTVWLSRYQRSHRLQADFPRPNRFRYRDGNACLVHHGAVFCMPQDCPEVFALDLCTGELVWSSNDTDVADCTNIVGVRGKSLILGGDRLVWLHGSTGSVLSQFPSATTPGTMNALPQPRGLGQAGLIAERVYFPTAQQLFVFAADQSNRGSANTSSIESPVVLEQMSTRYVGAEGANWFVSDPVILLATPGRLICFQADP